MKRGFTLIEIMIVVAIVIVLLTVAVPSILRSRVTSDETAALANLKILHGACQFYHMNERSYPGDLLSLSTANPSYIDSALGSGQKQGYSFNYNLVNSDHFTVRANPIHTGLLQGRFFYMDESGVVRARSGRQAGPNDQIVG